jgi:hypothetical protein
MVKKNGACEGAATVRFAKFLIKSYRSASSAARVPPCGTGERFFPVETWAFKYQLRFRGDVFHL